MESAPALSAATLHVEESGAIVRLTVGGRWDFAGERPSWTPPAPRGGAKYSVVVTTRDLERWDGSLVLFLSAVRSACERTGCAFVTEGLPAGIPAALFAPAKPVAIERAALPVRWVTFVGAQTLSEYFDVKEFARFIGNCTMAAWQMLRRPLRFRWRDCFEQMQLCGAQALPIVGLISLLVGVTMAYLAASILRQFGADIYVADFIGVAVLRELGPMMAAVVLAGRTGAAFAAQLGNMRANEEIDALETFGFSPIQFLVLPRVLALQLMMPLLALYANLLGILGGMFVAATVLQIPPIAYWIELKSIVSIPDLLSGLLKSVVFGMLIGVAGCLRGMQAERSAAGVGAAATSAVVTGLLFVIIANAVFAVVFNVVHF